MNYNFNFIGKENLNNISDDVEKLYFETPCYFNIRLSSSHGPGQLHLHDYIQIWYVLRGTFRLFFNDKRFEMRKGDLLIVPPYFSHRIDTSHSDDVEFIYLDISNEFLNIFPDSNEKNTLFNLTYLRLLFINAELMMPSISFWGNTAEQIEYYLFELLKENEKINELSQTYIRSNIARLFYLIAHEYEAIVPNKDDALYTKYRKIIQNALNYIDSHFTENICLEDISNFAAISVRSFSFLFKQITGKTFVEYLNYLRIRKICELLINSDKSILDICYDCGFNDLAYFCRTFKKLTGYPPRIYRKTYKKHGT